MSTLTLDRFISYTPGGLGRALRLLASSATMALFLTACSSQDTQEPTPSVNVQVATADTKPIQQIVVADAILFPKDQAAIIPQVSAPVKKYYVDRGSHVHAGQTLAELQDQEQAGTYQETQGSLDEAQANYDTAAQNAQQDLTLAKEQFDAAQKVFDGRQRLLAQGAVSSKDVEDARISLTQAQNQYQNAQKQYLLRVAQAQLSAAKGKATSAAAQLGYTKIVSPIDGVVTDRPYFAGETPAAGLALVTVMNLSEIVARAHIAQSEALRLKVGDQATIATAGLEEPLKAKVTLVSPALDANSTTVEVWVTASNPDEKLKPGSSARVSIVAQTLPKALVIPATALLTATDGSTSVITLSADNKATKKDVKIGVRNAEQAQVTDGLKPGERVVSTGAFELSSLDPDVLAKTTIQVQTAKPAASDDEK